MICVDRDGCYRRIQFIWIQTANTTDVITGGNPVTVSRNINVSITVIENTTQPGNNADTTCPRVNTT